MAELQIAEDLGSHLSKEQGRPISSLMGFRDGSAPSGTCTVDAEVLAELSTREYRDLSTMSLVAMTCGVGGLQVLWSTIFSHGSSYLFSLGISATQSSLIWAVAPICGSAIQPVVGVISDRSRISWGRRRPFILGGVVSTIFAATTLAWAEPISTAVCTLFGISNANGAWGTFTRSVAIMSIVILNISIQPLQLALRSLSIDTCPREQQYMASAWASRFAGVGNIIGYVLGSLPLPWISSDYEAMRFRYMVYCTTFALITTSFISCYFTEENPQMSTYEPGVTYQVYRIFQYLMDGFSQTPKRVRQVFLIQFFSWTGWFGFLFYSTSFIGQLYVDEQTRNNVTISSSVKDHGMRLGARANLLFATVALATNIVLPSLSCMWKSMSESSGIHKNKLHDSSSQLSNIWSFGQAVYVMSVLSTTMVSSSTTGTFLIAIAGFSWGVTQWVPFAIIGEETARHCIDIESVKREDDNVWSVVQGGKIMGLHNAAISIPQIIAALVSSAIFWISQKLHNGNALQLVIGWTGIPGAVAAWLAFMM